MIGDQEYRGELDDRRLLAGSLLTLLVLVIGLVVATPARAAAGMSDAEKIRRLDIMLMVTSLRCRSTPANFQADYGRFTTRHIGELNIAAAQLKGQLAKRYGAAGATRALDKLSVTMANSYGQGHPWLDCGQLRMVTRSLAEARGGAVLLAAADQLLEAQGTPQFAWAAR